MESYPALRVWVCGMWAGNCGRCGEPKRNEVEDGVRWGREGGQEDECLRGWGGSDIWRDGALARIRCFRSSSVDMFRSVYNLHDSCVSRYHCYLSIIVLA